MASKTEDSPTSEVDACLWEWAGTQLGPGYTVEQIDITKVKVTQRAVIYQGQGDWFHTQFLNEDIFTNEESVSMSWNYSETVTFQTQAKWSVAKTFQSSILPNFDVAMEFPGRVEGRCPVTVDIHVPHTGDDDASITLDENYPISSQLTLSPYCAMEARVKLKTCRLHETPFSCDIILSGPITVRGHKKRKIKSKMEVACNIETALKNLPGFSTFTGTGGGGVCTVHGTCSGEVPVEVCADFRDLQSLV